MRLFTERVTALMPTFVVTATNIQAIVEICQRLEGIPLAIELAAARANILSVEQIAGRLDDSLRLLKSSSRAALPRHQTLRTAIDWSYSLLPEVERLVFRHLGVFAGGGTLEAVEAVCVDDATTADADEEMVDTLSRLADKSLIIVDLRGGEARYRLLETLRQYGQERLVETGEAAVVRRRHHTWYLTLAERADAGLIGPQQVAWINRMSGSTITCARCSPGRSNRVTGAGRADRRANLALLALPRLSERRASLVDARSGARAGASVAAGGGIARSRFVGAIPERPWTCNSPDR